MRVSGSSAGNALARIRVRTGPGVERVDAHPGPAVQLVGEDLVEPLDRELRHAVPAPIGAPAPSDPRRGEDYRGVSMSGRGAPHEREEGAGEEEGRVDVDLNELLPSLGRVVLDGAEVPEQGGVVHESVEPAELALHSGSERLVVGGHRPGEVHRVDGGLRAALGPNLVVDALELLDGAPEQHRRRAMRGAEERDGPSDAVAGPGDEDHAAFEEVRRGMKVGKAGIESHRVHLLDGNLCVPIMAATGRGGSRTGPGRVSWVRRPAVPREVVYVRPRTEPAPPGKGVVAHPGRLGEVEFGRARRPVELRGPEETCVVGGSLAAAARGGAPRPPPRRATPGRCG